jgi:hypothetical protein
MAEPEVLAPDKNQPHAFEAGPEVPIVYPSSGASLQETSDTEGVAPQHTSGANCALCGAPRGAQIHVEGKAEADAASPRWGL